MFNRGAMFIVFVKFSRRYVYSRGYVYSGLQGKTKNLAVQDPHYYLYQNLYFLFYLGSFPQIRHNLMKELFKVKQEVKLLTCRSTKTGVAQKVWPIFLAEGISDPLKVPWHTWDPLGSPSRLWLSFQGHRRSGKKMVF